MVATTTPHDVALTITRHVHAPITKVFKAWTDPSALTKWFAPSDPLSSPHADMDLRVGGRYRIEIRAADGTVSTASGTFKEIRPPKRLAFTWTWHTDGHDASSEPAPETLVTVQFHDRDQVTDVILTHEHFLTPDDRHVHHERWTSLLNRLAHALPHHSSQ